MPNALVASLGLFTIIPVPPVADIDRRLAGRAMLALPWVGVIVGGLGGLVLALVSFTGAPLLPAVAGLAVLAWLTGALHLDGVADTADGLGSRKPADAALAIMKRSDIGPMGVITLLFVLLFDVAALNALGNAGILAPALALPVAAMLGRLMVGFAVRIPTARPGGFGALFDGVTTVLGLSLTSVLVGVVALGAGWVAGGGAGVLAFGVAAVVAGGAGWWWKNHLRARFGGMTGDTFGSLIEVTQAAFLVVAALLLSSL
ncbi:MAG: adenosylcobinamide-GDP ribazoletransferase [Tessaracoccus sp.]